MYQVISFDLKGGIASSEIIPWDIPEDLSHFGILTKTAPVGRKNAVIMGAHTWNTTPYFKERINIVLTRGKTSLVTKSSTPYRVHSVEAGEKLARELNAFRIFIIGGAQVLKSAKEHIRGSFLTRVGADYSCDTFLEDMFSPEDDVLSLPFISNNIPVTFAYQGDFDIYQNKPEWNYLSALHHTIESKDISQITSGQTRNIHALDMRFSLTRFPLLTTKRLVITNILESVLANTREEVNSLFPTLTEISGLSHMIHEANDMSYSITQNGNPLLMHFHVHDNKLHCKVAQSVRDIFTEVPVDIASYATLVYIICALMTNTGHPITPGDLHLAFDRVYIPECHLKSAIKQLFRPPFDFPTMKLNTNATQVEELNVSDFQLEEYTCYPKL